MDEVYMGTILLWAGNWCPQNMMFCAGQLLQVSQYQGLYSLIGNTYGGNQTSFNLPDLRSRVPLGNTAMSTQPPYTSLNVALGQGGGHASVTLSQAQIPAHTHALMVNNGQATTNVPTLGQSIAAPNTPAGRSTSPNNGFITGGPNVTLNGASIGPYGGNQPFDNTQPFLGLNYIICVNGVYPTKS